MFDIISLFDGLSAGHVAAIDAGIDIGNYYASEIDKPAISVTQRNFPNTVQLGDLRQITIKNILLSEVYTYVCDKYFYNDIHSLQSIISEREMLYRIDKKQTFAAYFGTQIPNENKEVSANPLLSINDRIWFFRNKMGGYKDIYHIARGGERRAQPNKIPIGYLCEHSFWWNGHGQSESKIKIEGIRRIKGKEVVGYINRENKTSSKTSVFDEREQGNTETEFFSSICRPNKKTKLLERKIENRFKSKNDKEKGNRKSETGGKVSTINKSLPTINDDKGIVRNNEHINNIYKNPQITVVQCEWGVLIFKGTFKICWGGSPCQDISNLSTSKEGLNGEKSSLFYEYLRIKNELNPDYFLLENVSGNKEAIKRITKEMGCRPLRLNSNLVSAQNRNRLYWTNIPVTSIPKDEKIYLQDILEKKVDERYFLSGGRLDWLNGASGQRSRKKRFVGIDTQKAGCLTRRSEASWNTTYITDKGRLRKLTPLEYERLQTLPDNYTAIAKEKDRYEMIGNCWTVKIISHIFKHIPKII